ncbi:MAG: histidine phosphatase family protein [Actinobacteria bacterium]|nr:histidine phosphatase family protein [Actinomycetota bacterium]
MTEWEAPTSAEPAIPSTKVVYLVRHGRTALNAAGLLRGHLDVPLDDLGWSEAQRLGDLFRDVTLACVVASPLARALETAAPIASATDCDVRVDDDLIDRDYGPWAGKTHADVVAAWGNVDAAPDVEPLDAFSARVLGALCRLVDVLGDAPGLVVAHEAVNQALLAHLMPGRAKEPWGIPQRTACWNRLELTPDGWRAPVVDAVPGDGRLP